jgi:hypothetical protein
VRFRFLAFGLIAGLLVACTSSKPGGTPTPTDTPTPSVATSTPTAPRTGPLPTGPNVRPGEKPPVLPAGARKRTDFGASLFGAYYFRALDWTIATNDDYLIRRISLDSCSACTRVRRFIAALNKSGDVLRGGRIHLQTFGTTTGTFNYRSERVVRVVLKQAAETRQSPSGATSRVAKASRDISLVFLNWTSAGWRVVEVAAP